MTKESLQESIDKYFGSIPDQRVVTKSAHKLVDIIAIAILVMEFRMDFRVVEQNQLSTWAKLFIKPE